MLQLKSKSLNKLKNIGISHYWIKRSLKGEVVNEKSHANDNVANIMSNSLSKDKNKVLVIGRHGCHWRNHRDSFLGLEREISWESSPRSDPRSSSWSTTCELYTRGQWHHQLIIKNVSWATDSSRVFQKHSCFFTGVTDAFNTPSLRLSLSHLELKWSNWSHHLSWVGLRF